MLPPAEFPNLQREGYTPTSSATPRYNCIAWAAGDNKRWWWPSFSYYWPPGATRANSIEAFIEAFATLGYSKCDDNERFKPLYEPHFERVAIYVVRGVPSHAARQIDDKAWTSKIGNNIDISHTLRGLEGPQYGMVSAILRRPRPSPMP